jgi:hypothetical protein
MEKSSTDRFVKIKVLQTPLLFRHKSLFRLSDFSYGEWLIFEKGIPKYYLNSFEEPYAQLIATVKMDMEKFLLTKFKQKKVPLDLRGYLFGIPLESQSKVIELNLERLPIYFFED